ncbi:hypothetical protein KEM48_007728 [Puccinia striiformis f. sp. tritici PST-130]|nr:hypothetical protein KEM48_007728 [Puccinia striiformis f. sp. tritici PST-130]
MSHQSPTAGGGSDPSYGQGRYDWVHNGTQVSRNPSSNLSKATTDRSSDNYASEAPENAAKHSYGAAHLGFLNDELLSQEQSMRCMTLKKRPLVSAPVGISPRLRQFHSLVTPWLAQHMCAADNGWPILSYFKEHSLRDLVSGFGGQKNLGGYMRAPTIPSFRELIDPDTPRAARHRVGADGEEYELVFSDEFNVDGRTFWKGDDPFWEAADQHYWPTGDREWYDPDAARTEGGYMETGVTMPGRHDVGGFWRMFKDQPSSTFAISYLT